MAFSGLGDLFDGFGDELFGRLSDPQGRALDVALFRSAPSEAPGDLDALPRAVLSVLRALAVEATVVVAIDDGSGSTERLHACWRSRYAESARNGSVCFCHGGLTVMER